MDKQDPAPDQVAAIDAGVQGVAGFYIALPPVEQPTGVTVSDIIQRLLAAKRWLVLGAALGAAAGMLAFWVMRPLYRAQVLVAPAAQEESGGMLSKLASQFGGVAELGGIDLTAQGGVMPEAVAVLESHAFVADFITRKNLLPVLFPAQWNAPDPRKRATVQKAVERFSKRVMAVEAEKATQFVTLRIDWYDRKLAAQWANELIATLNQTMRQRAIVESRESVEYLRRELERTQVMSIQQSLNKLIEEQMRRGMLANTRSEYVVRVLDPAFVPDASRYIRPSWALLVGGGLFGGLLLAGGIVLMLARDLRQGRA